MSLKLRPYQEKILDATKNMRHCALFLEQGLGKTAIALKTASHLYGTNFIDRVLVVSRGKVAENWHYEEIPKFLSGDVPVISYTWRSDKPLRMTGNIVWAGSPTDVTGKLLVVCMNKEALLTVKGKSFLDEFFKGKVLFIIDESTIIKGPTTKTTRISTAYGNQAIAKRILSGTPSPNGVEDLFSQYRFLDPNILGTTSVVAFRRSFCELQEQFFGGRRVMKTVGSKNQADLERLVAPFTIRLTKAEALPDLPEKTYTVRKFDLYPEQRKAYDNLRDSLRAELFNEDGSLRDEVTATLVIQRITRLQQITSGFVVPDSMENTPYIFEKNAKMDALMDIVAERGHEKTIIWARYRQDIATITDRINAELGPDSAAALYGGVEKDQRHENLEQFMRGRVSYLVANPMVASHGLTLTVADTCIYYSNSYNWEDRAQSEDRIHRMGMRQSAHYIDLVAHDTIDQRVLEVLQTKASFNDSLWKTGYSQWFM